ncbi:MAG TPA: GNAT family N-acetyltransferase [Verrucomicrobiae bacterium]|nr:GNAT family N-acetyltransferase [Verrucomicrobiae bacterium]
MGKVIRDELHGTAGGFDGSLIVAVRERRAMQTKNLEMVAQRREEVRRQIEGMKPEERAELSAAWLALLEGSGAMDPWIHGFVLVHRVTEELVGRCGFKGPPGADGVVEIAYGVAPEHQGKGYGTEAAEALVNFAVKDPRVRVVRAHTLPQASASTRVLAKCGFRKVDEVIDPEDGLVWRWEKQ